MSVASWTGPKDRGSNEYDVSEMQRVLECIRTRRGPERAISIQELAQRAGVEARAVRSILSDHDGLPHVLAYTADRAVYVAQFREEEEAHTRTLEATVRTIQERIARRQRGGNVLPRRQGILWD